MYIPNQFVTEIQNDRVRSAARRQLLAASRREQAAHECDEERS